MDFCFRQKLCRIVDSKYVLSSLVKKNLYGRYRNTALGFGWHFISPLLMLLIYYFVFTQLRTGNLPNFWVFLSCGLFPFNYLISNFNSSSTLIISNSGIVKKIAIPREILIFANVISSLITTILGYVVVLSIIALSGYPMSVSWSLIPFLFLAETVFIIGFSMAFSAITVYFRDFQYIINSLNLALCFTTPMYFSTSSLTGLLGSLVWLNPFTYFVEAYHQVVYYGVFPEGSIIIMIIVLSLTLLIVGGAIFYKLEKGFAEHL